MSNFIARHIISKIESEIKKKQSILKHESFYYFDIPVSNGVKKINRFNRWNPYMTEEILPYSWYTLQGGTLVEILDKIKNNKFYIYKKVNGKDCKTRIRNEQVSK
jgi:hypothetical protein